VWTVAEYAAVKMTDPRVLGDGTFAPTLARPSLGRHFA